MRVTALLFGISFLVGCATPPLPPVRSVALYQKWQLQRGQAIASYSVTNVLGDVGIALRGQSVYAPVNGKVQPHQMDCAIFSSPELPGYLFRLCGIDRPRFGDLQAGDEIGTAQQLQLATLRKQPNGKWAFVEPSPKLIEQFVRRAS